MPTLKQPASLRNLVMDKLIDFCTSLCVTVSSRRDLERLRRVVIFVKNYAAPRIPPQLQAEFHNRILKLLWSDNSELKKHPFSRQEIVFGMILDKKIVGLECEFLSQWKKKDKFPPNPLHPNEAYRIRGLMRLTIGDERFFRILPKLNLEDLQYLAISKCEDKHLIFIADKCPKLERLVIFPSKGTVTDVKLRALDYFRDVKIIESYDHSLSLHAVDQFLSATDGRKRELLTRFNIQVLEDPFTLTYRFIEFFGTQHTDIISNRHLDSIVQKFPNLRELSLRGGTLDGDLAPLSDLDKLSCLEIDCRNVTWTKVESLLRRIGANIRKFVFRVGTCNDQNVMNSIFELCANVEYLHVETNSDRFTQFHKIVVPEFKNLTHLRCDNNSCDDEECEIQYGELQFGAMLKLEELTVHEFNIERGIEPIILDHENFPNLKKITIWVDEEFNFLRDDIDRLRRIARINNLDLEIIEKIHVMPDILCEPF